jgi:hypothetical protein
MVQEVDGSMGSHTCLTFSVIKSGWVLYVPPEYKLFAVSHVFFIMNVASKEFFMQRKTDGSFGLMSTNDICLGQW